MSRKASAPAALVTIQDDKAARVETARGRIMALFDGADQNKTDFIRDHVQQLAWLGVTIIELQAEIDENGPVLPFDNGGCQKGYQANPACKTLKDFQTLYNAQFKALLPVLPEKSDKVDPFAAFRPLSPEEEAAEEAREEARQKQIRNEIAAAQKKLEAERAKHGQ